MPGDVANLELSVDDRLLDQEFAFTTKAESCRSIYSIDQFCRRRYKHNGDHACGYGSQRRVWSRNHDLDALTDLTRYASL